MKNILITGAAGFIGSRLCHRLASGGKTIAVDITSSANGALNFVWEKADLIDVSSVAEICEKYSPDSVVHCAGIAHQKLGAVDEATYMKVNSKATENLARSAAAANHDLHFIFLSSISVYGEYGLDIPVSEEHKYSPSSDYAVSKLDAEKRLIKLYEEGLFRKLTILRLAPVYDREWGFNLERRVFAPKKMAYLKFGKGRQEMSALARPNLVDFIEELVKRSSEKSGSEIMNVCDRHPYEFNNIIKVFKKSGSYPIRPTISIPLPVVWLATRIAGVFFKNKKNWLHSCYEKLASSLVFDNTKMLETGFKPRHTLETVFSYKE